MRRALKDMGLHHGYTRQQLANNLWTTESKFGAVVAHDNSDEINLPEDFSSTASVVSEQPGDRLFFICSPFTNMRQLFDALVEKMAELARSLGGA